MPRSAKEQVDITALLKGILNGYPGNTAIFREYLQNSDDARATKQIFTLDEQQHPKRSLCDPSLHDSQGPAILAYNDGVLSEHDWEALRKIHSSSKKTDETQTGKNGLGFRASYHLTENPHVLSGKTLMILDPHHRFDEHPGGISIDIVDEGAYYPDQLKPFSDFIGDKISPLSGTVFRLPLRTENQANSSKIKDTPTSVEEMRTLLYEFCNAELEQVVLFLKHITHIEICHVDAGGHRQVVGSVSIEDINPGPSSFRELKFRKIMFQAKDGSATASQSWCYRSLTIDKGEASKVVSERLGYDVADSLTADKLFPSIELATPLDGRLITGSLFTLLPLPIKTSFPVHLNAVFALTPDRQSLKNIEEVGTIESRERRLVEWNKIIFEVWTPCAWADLLEELSSLNAPWALWPPEEKNAYWKNLTLNLMKEVVRRNSPIFPVASDVASLLSLDDSSVLISPPSFPLNLIHLLAKLGVKIVSPPAHIFAIFESDEVSVAARILSPETLHGVLEAGYQHDQWQHYDPNTVNEMIEYLVFSTLSPSLCNLIGLPWFVQPDGSSLTLQRPGIGVTCIISSSEEEAHLFGSYLQVMAWPCSSDKLFAALCDSGSPSILNIALLQPSHVIDVLSRRFTRNDATNCEPDPADLAWILVFWAWLEQWGSGNFTGDATDTAGVWNDHLSGLYLLPTTSGRLRCLSDRVVHFSGTDSSIAIAWEKLGVPLLHRGVSSRVMIMLAKKGLIETAEKSSFIPFLLDNSDVFSQNALLPDDFEAIRRSLYSAAIRQRSSPLAAQTINLRQKEILEQLSIFSVRNAGGGRPALKSVIGNRLHVAVSDDFPLPFQQPPAVYVDLGDPDTKTLIQMLGPMQATDVVDLLCIAVDHWDLQPSESQDRIIDLMFDNWRKLPPSTQKKLEELPFVTVNGTLSRVAPKNLIHPNAPITPLFEGEVGRIPIGRFAALSMVTTMHSLGFLPISLDHHIVQERLNYLCQNLSQDQKLFNKAKTFVRLLDQHWDDRFGNSIRSHRHFSWIPRATPYTLCSPNESRDQYRGSIHSDPNFYDLVLTVLPKDSVHIFNRNFRSALGWSDRVSTDILVRQLSKTVLLSGNKDRYKRLGKLIAYMSQLHDNGNLSSEDVSSIRSELTGHSWIPTSASTTETVKTEYALLSGEYLKPPFRPINAVGSHSFLVAMGCTERPKREVLVLELQKYDSNIVSTSDMPAIIALLQEIATSHPGFDQGSVSIPDQSRRCRPIDKFYYPDTHCLLPKVLQDRFPTHRSVSRALSDQLGIQPLSSLVLELVEDAFDDDEQMGEDLIDRIRGFLREYDISYALNEFLANADDAHAHEFSILLDRRRPSQVVNGLISPEFYEVQRHHSIVLFNDSTLSDEDFQGLRRVGRGGKEGQSDTHGRHGLGALSFYYFTDVVTVISGAYVMFLNPSGRYLPPSRRQKRTSLVMKISDVIEQYPNQLRQYESLFAFSKETTSYRGTLFCLPLNASISVKRCDPKMAKSLLETSYCELAQNAFFFTGLKKITGRILTDQNEERFIWSFLGRHQSSQRFGSGPPYRKERLVWSILGRHQSSQGLGPGLSYHLLQITSGDMDETWMISTSKGTQIPDLHKTTAAGLKLTSTNLVVQLAIRLKPDLDGSSKSWLFSSLRLPRTTSLPFHLSARFAISSNRQSIVFDSPDSRKARDPKSDFNAWILAEVVPPLYLASLTFIIKHETMQHVLPHKRWWLLEPADDISHHVSQAFLTLLAQSDNEIFKSISGSLLSFSNCVFAGQIDPIVRALYVLNAPRLVTEYIPTALAKLTTATAVNEAYVRSVLMETSLETIKLHYADGAIRLEDLLALLRYIRKETALAGLPLLISATNIPILIPDISGRRIYVSGMAEHADLFKSACFLDHKYSEDRTLDEIWSSPSINVARLTENEVQHLICNELNELSPAGKANWLQKFWMSYNTLPGPPSPDSLHDVKLMQGSLHLHSLRECQPNRVVLAHTSLEELRLPLQHLGIDVVKPEKEAFRTYLLTRFGPESDAIVNILKCMAAKDVTHLRTLDPAEAKILANWLTASIVSSISRWRRNDPEINLTHLAKLEIWTAITSRGETFRSASTLAMLPSHFSIEALTPYIRPGFAIISQSYEISAVLVFCKNPLVRMTAYQILNSVDIPRFISDDAQMHQFANFLRNLFSFDESALASISGTLRVFDSGGTAQPVHALYDHSVELLSVTLKHTSSLLHPLLRFVDVRILRTFGLKHEISVPIFHTCVRAVQAANRRHMQDGTPTRDELFEMASLAFHWYKTTLPQETITWESYQWNTFDCIEFVRAKDTRRRGASYPAKDYCRDEPRILFPPSRFVLPDLEPIAWTQRVLFFHELPEVVTMANEKLGIPEVDEVVAHLKVLTTEIAVNHPGNLTLLSDIKATYKWLNEHAEDAREHMLLLGREKLFLNVDNPTEDQWVDQWATADELVLNVPYDYGDVKRVKEFLQDYSDLLRVAGCSTMSFWEHDAATTEARHLMMLGLMEIFDEMRKSAKTTDVLLVPTNYAPEEILDLGTCSAETAGVLGSHAELLESEEEAHGAIIAGTSDDIPDDVFTNLLELRAHKVVLAASSPHVRSWAEDWKHDMSHGMDLLSFDGTYFCAKAVLDFVYTGEFDYPIPGSDDSFKNLLYELLGLLRIADLWDMPALKEKVENEIHKHDLVQRFLPLHQKMLRVAELYHANRFRDSLNQMARENSRLLQRLSLV